MDQRRVGVGFFGITRSLTYTLPALERHILAPARAAGSLRVFAHLFRQTQIDNPRSGEQGKLDPDEHRLLAPDWLDLEEPGGCLAERQFEAFKRYGDSWADDFRSLRNLIHQLHSLDKVAEATLEWGADVVIFARPDLRYHDSLRPALKKAMKATEPTVFLPRWQPHGGLNDRFAICVGAPAITAYARRIRHGLAYCEAVQGPLHGESLVKFALEREGIPYRFISARASRVRADGQQRFEEFASPQWAAVKASIRPKILALADKTGLSGVARTALKTIRPGS